MNIASLTNIDLHWRDDGNPQGRPVVFANSLGPDLVSAMVFSNTAAKIGDQAMWLERIASIEAGGIESMSDAILARWFSPEFLASSEAIGWRHMLQRTPLQGYVGCCHAIAGTDLSEQCNTLRLPVMGIAGSEDGASPAELVKATIDLIRNARCHIIEGAGHLPCVEKPANYAALLCQFIKETAHD